MGHRSREKLRNKTQYKSYYQIQNLERNELSDRF